MKNICDKPPRPGENYLPKTGQLWWPVCALSAAGLLLILIGLIRRRRNADYEK